MYRAKLVHFLYTAIAPIYVVQNVFLHRFFFTTDCDPHCDLETRDLNSTGKGVAEWVKGVEGEGAWMGLWMVRCEREWRGRVVGGNMSWCEDGLEYKEGGGVEECH